MSAAPVIVDHRGEPIRSAPQRKRLANTEPVARSGNIERAIRGFNRDRPIGYTIAPQPARQIWELHRIREESRQQSLISPHFSGFLEWVKTQVVGFRPFGLRFPSMPDSERDRLRDPALYVRDMWREYQDEPIGVRDETLAEMVGQCLDWMLVDGDCFVMPERRNTGMRYRTYPGDALAETSHTPGTIGRDDTPQRALGIEVDADGRPTAYFFGQRARFRSLGYTSWSTQVDELRVPAAAVWHIRDRRRHGGTVRGWPKVTAAYEYIARLNEFDQAFVRAAIRRVGAAIALKRSQTMTVGDFDRDGEEGDEDLLASSRIENAGARTDESIKPYQESEAHAGDILELDPGYDPVSISTGSPSQQDAQIVGYFESRVCMALGLSVPTLTGSYGSVSYSGGQLGLIKERATADDLQYVARRQLIRPVYRAWLDAMWVDLLMRFPRLKPDDYRVFMAAEHTLPRMPVLEKGKIIAAVEKAVKAGLITFPEARAEVGYTTDDVEAVLAEIREQREMLGAGAVGEGDEPDDEPE